MKEITQLNEIARTHKSRRICGGSRANLLPQVCVPGTKATFLQAMRSLQQEALLLSALQGSRFFSRAGEWCSVTEGGLTDYMPTLCQASSGSSARDPI